MTLNLTNITILNSVFKNFKDNFSFIVTNGTKIESIINNLLIERNIFIDT